MPYSDTELSPESGIPAEKSVDAIESIPSRIQIRHSSSEPTASLVAQKNALMENDTEKEEKDESPSFRKDSAKKMNKLKILDDKDDEVSSLRFGDEIKILLIPAVDWRIMCHFLGVQAVNDVKSVPYSNVPMIGLLLMECLSRFMRSKGYTFAGEINFTDQGMPIPVTKQVWLINEEEVTFTRFGYVFFEKVGGRKEDNVVFFNFSDLSRGSSGLTCYAKDSAKAKKIISELEEYTKTNNKVRGAKLRDINMFNATFSEVTGLEKSTWDNFYYEEHIKDMFELEVFGFLNNVEKYEKKGITKRGFMISGIPGSGKTSLGRIVCNKAKNKTVIWITPDLIAENNGGKHSIKLLYTLADFVSPSVVILEDLDLFANDRQDGGDTLRLGSLMNILDGVNSIKNSVTIAMTNRLKAIEGALRNRPGRFDRIVEVPALNRELRNRMLNDRLVDFKVDDDVMDHILSKTEKDWTGADVQELVNSINMYFVHNDMEKDLHLTLEIAKKVLKTMAKFSIGGDAEENNRNKIGFDVKRDD